MIFLVSGYSKLLLKHCADDDYKTNIYDTLEKAMSACTSSSGCGGVYDAKCDGTGSSLCPTGITYGISVESCIYHKGISHVLQIYLMLNLIKFCIYVRYKHVSIIHNEYIILQHIS